MTHRLHPTRLRRCAVPLLAAALVATPLPALAAESLSTAPPPTSVTLLSQATLAATQIAPTVSAAPRVAVSQQGPAPTTDLGSKSFFRTPAGIISLVAAGVALGYALYSTSNDRIESPKVPYKGGLQ